MIHELRTYTCLPGKRAQVVEEQKKRMPVFEKYGIKVVGIWTTVIGRVPQVFLLMQYDSLADREKKWEKYLQDPDRLKILETAEPSIQYEDNIILQPTAYSPLR